MNNIVVAIDGPAGSGKSSVSRVVALKSGLKYIDSGAIYRTITLHFLSTYGSLDQDIDYKSGLSEISIKQLFLEDGSCESYLNDRDVSEDIRTEDIAKNIGYISSNGDIRTFVTNTLREWAETDSIIMDGRDIGTVVFPSADIKIYLDASVEERAKRRYLEYQEKGKNVDLIEIKNQIILRDNQDKSREVAPLKQADDALYLDTSLMTREEVILKIEDIIKKKNK